MGLRAQRRPGDNCFDPVDSRTARSGPSQPVITAVAPDATLADLRTVNDRSCKKALLQCPGLKKWGVLKTRFHQVPDMSNCDVGGCGKSVTVFPIRRIRRNGSSSLARAYLLDILRHREIVVQRPHVPWRSRRRRWLRNISLARRHRP